jgi:hypothetical protein
MNQTTTSNEAMAVAEDARSIYYAMMVYRGGLERKQALLFRLVDIALDLCHERDSI